MVLMRYFISRGVYYFILSKLQYGAVEEGCKYLSKVLKMLQISIDDGSHLAYRLHVCLPENIKNEDILFLTTAYILPDIYCTKIFFNASISTQSEITF